MQRISKRFLILCLIISIILTQVLFTQTAMAESRVYPDFLRLYGSDRYKTATAISREGWDLSEYAIIARGDDFPDALCAAPLAKKYNAPILLTEPDSLNWDTLNELKRLNVDHIIITGGYGAVSMNVESRLRAEGFTDIRRIYGSDRYGTSAEIAREVGGSGAIFLATGTDFPDALVVSSIAAQLQNPILLTEKYSLPYSVRNFIDEEGPDKTYVIGNIESISGNVFYSLPNPVRLGGTSVYSTNVQVMKEFEDYIDFGSIFIAIGEGPYGNEFADALTGSALAALWSSTVVLTGRTLPREIKEYLGEKLSEYSEVVALGGEAVLPSSVVNTLLNNVDSGWEDDDDYDEDYDDDEVEYDRPGTYGPGSGTKTIEDDVVISDSGVTLRNMRIEGNLVITEDADHGSIHLEDVIVKGTLTIKGEEVYLELDDCDIYTLIIDEDAEDTEVELNGDTNIDILKVYAPADITGYGDIEKAYVRSRNVDIDPIPGYLYVGSGIRAFVGGRTYDSGSYYPDDDDCWDDDDWDHDHDHDYDPVSAVYASHPSGAVAAGTKVSLHTKTKDAAIYYTLNNTVPNKKAGGSTYVYTGPIEINSPTVIRAIAVKFGKYSSQETKLVYSIAPVKPVVTSVSPTRVAVGRSISASGSKEGWLYLVPQSTPATKAGIESVHHNSAHSQVAAGGTVALNTTGFEPGKYYVYAIDKDGNVSEHSELITVYKPDFGHGGDHGPGKDDDDGHGPGHGDDEDGPGSGDSGDHWPGKGDDNEQNPGPGKDNGNVQRPEKGGEDKDPSRPSVNIESVADLLPITVEFGTDIRRIRLPGKVEVTLSDSSKMDVRVVWDTSGYDGTTAGEYTLTGTLMPIGGIKNSGLITAKVTIIVKPQEQPKQLPQPQPQNPGDNKNPGGRDDRWGGRS